MIKCQLGGKLLIRVIKQMLLRLTDNYLLFNFVHNKINLINFYKTLYTILFLNGGIILII